MARKIWSLEGWWIIKKAPKGLVRRCWRESLHSAVHGGGKHADACPREQDRDEGHDHGDQRDPPMNAADGAQVLPVVRALERFQL